MEILRRKLIPELVVGTISSNNCIGNRNCNESSVFWYCSNCDYISSPTPHPPPSLLPPPPPLRHESAQNLVVPYLISVLCALGAAFLILTTCTILLKYRRWRRRNSRRVASSGESVSIDEDHDPVDHPIWRIVTIGLQQSVIDSITTVKYKRCDGLIEGTDCSVCLTEFEEGHDLRLLPKCSHAFHLPCIDTWLRSHKNCPLCRAPVVNDTFPMNVTALSPNSTNLDSSAANRMENSDNQEGSLGDQAGQGETSRRRDRADEFDTMSIEGIRIPEVFKSNPENRALSDLGESHRVPSEDFQPVRRSISLDTSAASVINNAVVVNVAKLSSEGSSKQKKVTQEEISAKQGHRGSTMSRLIKSSSIGRSLQKSPVSMKRSFSSSAKILSSFRASKSQDTSILPL